MLNSKSDHVRFTAESILEGLQYHFRELGICQVLEEGLQELVERKMSGGDVHFKQDVWTVFSSDLERAMILLDLARVSRKELEDFQQGRTLLSLESRFVRAHGLEA
ncbi:MAG: hypothetical protein ACLFUJ_13375 [Phycisphaerae bacterium]